MGNKVYILKYLRKGLISSVKEGSSVTKDTKRAQIDVNLKFQVKNVNSGRVENKVLPGKKIELLGPADVKSLTSKAICRVSPAASGDVRLNASYRPYMEFYEEDLPWRYTPFAPGDSSFYPWMRLIAVKDDECDVTFRDGMKIVRINLTKERISEVFSTADELARSAHAQIDVEDSFNGPLDEATINEMLDENPDCGISRVLCVSKLEPATQYVLLLIPTFELGRLSALGMSTDGVNMNAIVEPKPNTDLELPIYYKWNCTTATRSGTFKDLADLLNFTTAADYKKMDANLTVDISHSGLKTVSFDGEKKIDVPAALVMSSDPYRNLADEGKQYRTELQKHLSLNPVFDENELGDINPDEDPWVVPPVYGARHMLTKRADFEKGPDAGVVNEVNLKLHNRIAAGMGGSVVMKNQEEFVHRAWKRVEVINALNQMLREYYQMNQVNDCAKDMNVRSSINKAALNNQNQGLISDAALRMLQTSGIYYNNVAPDTMLDYYDQMGVKDNGEATAGVSKQYLAQLYDQGIWKRLVDEDKKFDVFKEQWREIENDFIYNRSGVWLHEEMYELAFLKDMFKTTLSNGVAQFLLNPSHADRLMIKPDTLHQDNQMYSKTWNLLNTYTLYDDKKLVDPSNSVMRNLRYIFFPQESAIQLSIIDLVNRYQTFSDDHLSPSNIGSIRPYPISVILDMPYANACIVPDWMCENLTINGHILGKRIIAVEYYTYNTPSYYFIVTKSALDSLNPRYSLQYYKTHYLTPGSYPGKFDLFDDGSQEFKALDSRRPRNSLYYEQLDYYYILLGYASVTEFTIKDAKPGKKHKEKIFADAKDVYFIIDFRRNCLLIRIDDSKYKNRAYWLLWEGNYDTFCVQARDKNGKIKDNERVFKVGEFRQVISDAMKKIESIDDLFIQPDQVSISLRPDNPLCVKISLNDYYQQIIRNKRDEVYKENLSIDSPQLNQILNEVEKQRGRIESELKIKSQPANPNKVTAAADIEVVDPYQLARDRIKEIAEEYGVTEFNQLDDRLRDKYPVMVHPDFLDPTYFYLRELSVDYILPASGKLAKNSISCFYSNQAFEEAFLMGMNTEMGRELMWREYPTDQRGSYFRKFWDQSELPKKEELKSKYYDIEDIDKWKGKLGSNHRSGKSPMLVFAIKGDLMLTYPDTEVFLQQIVNTGNRPSPIQKKEMSAWLTSDTYLVGFSGIKKEDLKNYYLVFQQKPLSLQFSKQAENKNNPYGIVNPQCYLMPAEQ